jgi:crotonobetainyl-CoA:carnitine CoA-transferase CaiB-like acyl-CoA transferase
MSEGPLDGVVVIDIATLFAAPMAATLLADFGAEVIKVEHPVRGDPVRDHGYVKDGQSLWWKVLDRNKQAITLDIGKSAGADLLLRLASFADVLIENFRPGTLERWGVGPEQFHAVNPRLIVARVTGFGQTGPYARRPGFGTLAECMSGFAAMTGEPDGPPTLPPFALADGVAGQALANAILMALYHRDVRGGMGQVLDLAIIEPILSLLGPNPTVYDQLGVIPERTGNRTSNNAPRNTYRCRDGRWVAISTSTQSIAERVLRLVGHPEVIAQPWFSSGRSRAEHAEELDAYVGQWISERDLDEVVRGFEEAQAAVAPVYDIRDIMNDPQYRALQTIVTVDDEDLGPMKMQNVPFRLSQTPGRIRWTGRSKGEDNEEIFGKWLKLSQAEMKLLSDQEVI